ncbi:Alcohol dehydrogenase [acceptor] [Armadillidium vulgare]|nr:Alcohol dehydrogenase [acceptor] [Armadillidium vulgare]
MIGPFAIPTGVDSTAFHQISGGDPLFPDLQIFLTATVGTDLGFISFDGFGYKRELLDDYFSDLFFQESMGIASTMLRPNSRGSITLRSADPFDQPNIDPNYLADPEDLEFFVRATRFCLEILETNAMKAIGAKFFDRPLPGCRHLQTGSDDYWRCFARHMVSTSYHPVSDLAKWLQIVIRWAVRVVTGLRVADASIMPITTSGNTNAPAIMIGGKGRQTSSKKITYEEIYNWSIYFVFRLSFLSRIFINRQQSHIEDAN